MKWSSCLYWSGGIGIQQFCWNAFEKDLRAMLKISRLISSLWIMAGGAGKKGADGVY